MQASNDDKARHMRSFETPADFRVYVAAVIYLIVRPALIAATISGGSVLLYDRCNKKFYKFLVTHLITARLHTATS